MSYEITSRLKKIATEIQEKIDDDNFIDTNDDFRWDLKAVNSAIEIVYKVLLQENKQSLESTISDMEQRLKDNNFYGKGSEYSCDLYYKKEKLKELIIEIKENE